MPTPAAATVNVIAKMCKFLYAKGGIRIPSGAARVTLVLDGVERELRVVRDGNGRSRLERGEITLKELAKHTPLGATVKAVIHHRGAPIPVELDPRAALGGTGRAQVRTLAETIAPMNPVQRALLAEMQLGTLPYSLENAAAARKRAAWALAQSDRLHLSPTAVANLAGVLDAESTKLLAAKHANIASQIVFGIATGREDLTVDPDARAVLEASGLIDAAGRIPALEQLGLTEHLDELAERGAVLDERFGVLVGGVPGAAWKMIRDGGFTVGKHLEASSTSANAEFRDPEDRTVRESGEVYNLNGERVVFGSFSSSLDGARRVPRSPYEIASVPVGSPEGTELALRYTAALAAVSEARGTCYVEDLGRCSPAARCLDCLGGLQPLRDQAVRLLGAPSADAVPHNTVVDALLYAASRGDARARQEFDALAALGEAMVDTAREGPSTWAITPTMRKEYKATWQQTWSRSDEMVEAAAAAWADLRTEQVQAALVRGEISAEWAETLKTQIGEHAGRGGYAAKYTNQLRDELTALETMATSRYDTLKTHNLGLEDLFFVHETAYEPQRDEHGNVLLRPTGDWDDTYPRTSLHFAVNHAAAGHMWRSGDDAKYVIMVRAKELVDANPGTLDCLYAIDSYLSPLPGQPLVLPASATRTLRYDDLPGEKASGVHETLEALQRELTADDSARVVAFEPGTHYSSSSVNARMTELAAELGAISGLHQNLAGYRLERVVTAAEESPAYSYRLSLSAADLATLSVSARARIVAHTRHRGTDIEPVADHQESIS